METVTAPGFSSSNTSDEFDLLHFQAVNYFVLHEKFNDLLRLIDIDGQRHKPVNLMNDSMLNVVISANKTQLAVMLIEKVNSLRPLLAENICGDTALHIAAVKGNITVAEALLQRELQLVKTIAAVEGNITVAEAALQRESQLVKAVNKKGETAVHKAAMYGRGRMFWLLIAKGGTANAMYRKKDGSNMLHCAITGNAPELALDIARRFPELILSRDEAGLTPLQLIVTNPAFLRSPLLRGSLNKFLYSLIPLKVRFQARNARTDEEADTESDEESYGWIWKNTRSYSSSPFHSICHRHQLSIIASLVRYGVLVFFKQFYRTVNDLEEEKERYIAAMKLVEYLAKETSFDFYPKGYSREPNPTLLDAMRSHSDLQYTWRDDDNEEEMMKNNLKKANRLPSRWMEPPLIIAAELGLDDFVRKILQVCPQSAIYLDSKGRNVMQVAIQSGHEKVVRVINEMLQGSNPILPSYLPSMLDNKTRNTILHLAAENSPSEADALQLHHELVWFEMVEKIVPRELVYSRNMQGKTAHELLTYRHKIMLESCKDQLVKIGSTCAGLVATVVLTSSFSFPSERHIESGSVAFKIVSHAYMIGFGCAATALLLFLLLVLRPYKERDFRWAIPLQLSIAGLSFALALGAFYLTVVCNIILQIYGSKVSKKHLIPLILELALYPVLCVSVLFVRGVKISPSLFRI